MFVKDIVPLSVSATPVTKSSCSFEEAVMVPWTGVPPSVPLIVPVTDVPFQSKVALSYVVAMTIAPSVETIMMGPPHGLKYGDSNSIDEVTCRVGDPPIVMFVTATPTKKTGMPLLQVVVQQKGSDSGCIPTI